MAWTTPLNLIGLNMMCYIESIQMHKEPIQMQIHMRILEKVFGLLEAVQIHMDMRILEKMLCVCQKNNIVVAVASPCMLYLRSMACVE